jgi:hypothetical protein
MTSPAEATKNSVDIGRQHIVDQCERIRQQRELIERHERDGYPDLVADAVQLLGDISFISTELHRVAGEIMLASGLPDEAEEHFAYALAVARQQQAKSWELPASMSLARLWRDQGKVQQARELLAPVYGWFTEGFDTLDLKEAKTLLEELAV